VAVIVAHPDDETLWAAGLLLTHPRWSSFVVSLCRGGDLDRAPKFTKALERLGAKGAMGNLDDGPDQFPLSAKQLQDAILSLLPEQDYDIVLTHAPQGEYTWHRRHGEVSLAVRDLWRDGRLRAKSMWQFAYEDGGGAYAPQAQAEASFQIHLSEAMRAQKYDIITQVYGFDQESWEARAVGPKEAFHRFNEGDRTQALAEIDRRLIP
jgi:LmbE family N-acetylglucosaminyl deacetylase